jgi:probable HAF family extracellular repeat protein
VTDVGSFGGKINAACAINDAGQVTGYSQDENGNFMASVFSRNHPIRRSLFQRIRSRRGTDLVAIVVGQTKIAHEHIERLIIGPPRSRWRHQ